MQSMKGNLKITRKMGRGYTSLAKGSTMVNFLMVSLMVRVNLSTLMETIMKVSSKII